MSDEKLRLVAEVQDRMSPALRKIKDTLSGIRKSPGMEAATDGMKKLGTETAKFAGFGGSAATALDALGIGGLATAGSLAAVVVQMRALGERSLQMKELARETGVSANWLNVWSHAGLSFGVSADTMQSGLNHLTGQMPQFRRHIGSLYNLMAQRWPNLTQKILGEDAEHQVKDIVGLLDQLKNEPQLQKQLASEFFGNGDEVEKLFRDGAKGFWDEFAKQQKLLNPINPELFAQAQKFKDAQIGFNDALENFENSAGPQFLNTMTAAVKEAEKLVHLAEGPEKNGGWGEWAKKAYGMTLPGVVGNIEGHMSDWLAKKLREPFEGPNSAPPHAQEGQSGALQGETEFNKRLNDSLSKANPLFHKSAFVTGGSSEATGIISDGTKSGVLAAFREMMATNDAAKSPDVGGGFTKTSFESGESSVGGFHSSVSALREHHRRATGDMLGPGGDTPAGKLHASGAMSAHAKETYDFWRGVGLSRNAALGFVGNEQGEGTLGDGKPHLHWDSKHFSGGIVQWDPARRGDIMKHTGIDVWHDANHQHQLEAEQWEIKNRYPDLWKALKSGKITTGQAAHALVFGYEKPANKEGQSRLRGSFGEAWGNRLTDGPTRKATGLSPGTASGASGAAKPTEGHIRADIHVHGGAHKATVKTRGKIEASLHRWPKMEMV